MKQKAVIFDLDGTLQQVTDRKKFIHLVLSKLYQAGSPPVEEYKYDVPKLPHDLSVVTTKRDADYLKYIKKLFNALNYDNY